MFAPHQEPWRFRRRNNAAVIVPGFLFSQREHLSNTPLRACPSFLPFVAVRAHETCFRDQNKAGDSSKYHRRHCCLLLQLLGFNHNLLAKPLGLCHLRDRSRNHRLFGPSFSPSLTPDIQCRPTLPKMSALCRDFPPRAAKTSLLSSKFPRLTPNHDRTSSSTIHLLTSRSVILQRRGPSLSITAALLFSTSAPIPCPSKQCFRWPPLVIFWRSRQA